MLTVLGLRREDSILIVPGGSGSAPCLHPLRGAESCTTPAARGGNNEIPPAPGNSHPGGKSPMRPGVGARHDQDRGDAAADGRVRGVGQLRRPGRQDRRGRDQRGGRRAREEARTRHRGQQVQSDGSRVHGREAHRARQGAGDDGRVELHPDARHHAEADGIRNADAGGDVDLAEDHGVGQSLHLPHRADVGDRGDQVQAALRQARHQEGELPQHQQRFRDRVGAGDRQGAEGGRPRGRHLRDHGPEGHGFLRAAHAAEVLRQRHDLRHDGGGAEHADPSPGGRSAGRAEDHHARRVELPRSAHRAGGRGGERVLSHRLLPALVSGSDEVSRDRAALHGRVEQARPQHRRADGGLPRLRRHPRDRRGHQGRGQGRAGGDPPGPVESAREGDPRRGGVREAGARRQGERAEFPQHLSRQDREREDHQARLLTRAVRSEARRWKAEPGRELGHPLVRPAPGSRLFALRAPAGMTERELPAHDKILSGLSSYLASSFPACRGDAYFGCSGGL